MTENEALLRIKDLEYECVNSTIHYYTDKDIPTLQLAQKALEEIQQYRSIGTVEEFKHFKRMLNVAEIAVNHYEQYEKIGTVEEFKALKEKAEPKKPRKIRDNIYDRILHYSCPICGRYFGQRGEHNMILFNKELYCKEKNCGQAIDWSDEE